MNESNLNKLVLMGGTIFLAFLLGTKFCHAENVDYLEQAPLEEAVVGISEFCEAQARRTASRVRDLLADKYGQEQVTEEQAAYIKYFVCMTQNFAEAGQNAVDLFLNAESPEFMPKLEM